MKEITRVIVGLILIAIIITCVVLAFKKIVPFWVPVAVTLIIRGIVPESPKNNP